MIVGGHSHTFLYDPATAQTFSPPNLSLTPVGAYPTVVESPADEPVLVVTAFEWGKFLGRLDVSFGGDGIVTAYDGNPIYVSNTVAKDPAIEALIAPYREDVNDLMTLKVGEITVDAPLSVDGKRICRLGECLLGNVVTDAMLWQVNTVGGGDYQIAVTNGGGLRAALLAGDVTYGGVMNVLPFGNTIATMGLKGSDLLAALEHSVRSYPGENGGFLQVSGMLHVRSDAAGGLAHLQCDGVERHDVGGAAARHGVQGRDEQLHAQRRRWLQLVPRQCHHPYDFGPGLHEAVIAYFETFSPVTPVIEGRIGRLRRLVRWTSRSCTRMIFMRGSTSTTLAAGRARMRPTASVVMRGWRRWWPACGRTRITCCWWMRATSSRERCTTTCSSRT